MALFAPGPYADLLGCRPSACLPVASAPGTVDLFWKGTDGHLWHAYFVPGRNWYGLQNLGGHLYPVSW
jgi:hypothetical protein